MEQMLQSIPKESEKMKAFVAQLRFRQTVLKQVLKDKSILKMKLHKVNLYQLNSWQQIVWKLIKDDATVDK